MNNYCYDYVALQIGYEKTAYTVTEKEREVELCIHVPETTIPARFYVTHCTMNDSAGICMCMYDIREYMYFTCVFTSVSNRDYYEPLFRVARCTIDVSAVICACMYD